MRGKGKRDSNPGPLRVALSRALGGGVGRCSYLAFGFLPPPPPQRARLVSTLGTAVRATPRHATPLRCGTAHRLSG